MATAQHMMAAAERTPVPPPAGGAATEAAAAPALGPVRGVAHLPPAATHRGRWPPPLRSPARAAQGVVGLALGYRKLCDVRRPTVHRASCQRAGCGRAGAERGPPAGRAGRTTRRMAWCSPRWRHMAG